MTAESRIAQIGIPARNWAGLADWVHQHYCWERQHSGSCGHKACKHAAELEQAALSLDMGQASEYGIDDFRSFVRRKQCHFPHACNHKGCAVAESVKDWLTMQAQKAA